MGYSENDRMVRVDFFKESGKWYATHAMQWTGSDDEDTLLSREFAKSLLNLLEIPGEVRLRYSGMLAVCLEPYHATGTPLAMHVDDVRRMASEESGYVPMHVRKNHDGR